MRASATGFDGPIRGVQLLIEFELYTTSDAGAER